VTIQEAIKSGKPFRRGHWFDQSNSYYRLAIDGKWLYYYRGRKGRGKKLSVHPSKADILATDWEIKP
jgi:hypothetical protein